MSPSQTQPFTHLILTSHVLVAVCLLLSLPTQCTSLRSNDAAFTSNYILNQPSIRKTTVLLYQIIDEPLNKQRISPSAKKDSKDEDTTDQVVLGDTNDSKNIQLDNNEAVEDNKDWISATRNIGSLILHLKDETKDSNVDVFGRPLNLPQIDQFGLPKDYDNSDDNGAGWQSSLASYLLKLKRDEEDNRERIFEENKGRKRSIMEDGESSKSSMNIQLDQVSFLSVVSQLTHSMKM